MFISIYFLLLHITWVFGRNDASCSDDDASSITELISQIFRNSLGSTCACGILEFILPGQVFLPGATNYTVENTHYWDLREDLSPKCVFVPETAHDVAKGVLVLKSCKSQFAIRGGGHMPVKGAANTDGGVLLALSAFRNITVHPDSRVVEAGPALPWVDVFTALEPYGRIVIGGRLASIGIAGLTLGGGINYFTNKWGFAMDNVLAYEVVTGEGEVLTANATHHRDLFWALKGGSNNFGIVTKLTYQTYEVPTVSTLSAFYLDPALPTYSKAIDDLARFEEVETTPAGGIFSLFYDATTDSSIFITLGVQAGSENPPSYFSNFSAIPAAYTLQSVTNVTTVAQASYILNQPEQEFRQTFGAHSFLAGDPDNIAAMYTMFKNATKRMANVTGFRPTMAFQPIPKSAIAVAANNGIGNVWGLDEKHAYIFYDISIAWTNESDDALVYSWLENTLETIHAANKAKGLAIEFLYLNDAADYQQNWGYTGIGKGNLERMRKIRGKYDPEGVFRKLCDGGFKFD